MPTSSCTGGHIEQQSDKNNYAGVIKAESAQIGSGNTGDWVVTLKAVPLKTNYTRGMALTYNSKGTSNPNANNYLKVTSVVGPAKYKCSGPYPING